MTEDLRSHLWECAEILRGSAVDRTDWKAYILPLLFFKRISDVWDEEAADAATLFGDAEPVDFPEVHRFIVPEDCHWRDVRETPANIGAALSRAMREIERANPGTLYRVFGAADWGNREMLTDEILKDLMEGLSGVSLGNKAVSTDILGDSYEYLIGKFADITKRNKAGEFYTPRSVVRMMVDLLDPKAGESIYDPACGTGGMLLGAIEHVQRAGGDPRTFFGKIFGQEKNLTTASIARMNLVLHGIEDFQIVREDTLRSPAFTDSATGGLATFDCVIANPPFSLKEWGRDVWEADPWGRAQFGGYFDTANDLKPLLHTWSLAVEEQYYLLFPLLLIVTRRLGQRGVVLSLLGVALSSFALSQWSFDREWEWLLYHRVPGVRAAVAPWDGIAPKSLVLLRRCGGSAGEGPRQCVRVRQRPQRDGRRRG